MSDQSLTKRPETRMESIRSYVMSPEVRERFTDMMGANAIYYLNQVMIVVANSTKLQECEPGSILISAMRAASLRLSVDPAKGQAWIIPFKGKATFQLGYKGVYELAMRTNQYRFINVIKVYDGETIVENRMTGNHTLAGKGDLTKVIAYMLYFQLFNGFEKTFVMTVPEIEAHAAKYSQSYSYQNSPWNDPIERPKMMSKTVMTNGLRKWGRFNEADWETIEQIETDQGWQDRLTEPLEGVFSEHEPVKVEENKAMSELGFDTGNAKAVEIVPAVVQAAQELGGVITMTREEAEATLNSKNQRYGDIDSETLDGMVHGINKGMQKPGADVETYTRKLKAIGIILAARENDDDEYARQAENE